MRYITVENINHEIKTNAEGWVNGVEQAYDEMLEGIARQLAASAMEKPVVLLSGPSGSGKTTTALRLGAFMQEFGIKTDIISMDNYFLPDDEVIDARDEDGQIDYESPYRLDIPMFNEHIQCITEGQEITLPRFVFHERKRVNGRKFARQTGEMVIFEGIHALNPMVAGISDSFVNGVYVSVRTRIQFDGALLHPSKIRLMRRIIRDRKFRARTVAETLRMYESVERGENLYIMPYKNRAKFQIDTMIPFEPAVYKKYLLSDLQELLKQEEFEAFRDMEEALMLVESVPKKIVPGNSLIREFIGGSTLKY